MYMKLFSCHSKYYRLFEKIPKFHVPCCFFQLMSLIYEFNYICLGPFRHPWVGILYILVPYLYAFGYQ